MEGLGNVVPNERLLEAISEASKYTKSPATYRRDVPMLPVGAAVEGDYVIDLSIPQVVNEHGHSGDSLNGSTVQGKLPWHPTFSDQSPYAGNGAPRWEEAYGLGPLGKDVYHPTIEQIQRPGYMNELTRYFTNEKGRGIDAVEMPIPYKQNKGLQ